MRAYREDNENTMLEVPATEYPELEAHDFNDFFLDDSVLFIDNKQGAE